MPKTTDPVYQFSTKLRLVEISCCEVTAIITGLRNRVGCDVVEKFGHPKSCVEDFVMATAMISVVIATLIFPRC